MRVLDNLSTGHEKNIQDLLSEDRFEFIEGDIRDYNQCLKVLEGISWVSHQAALGSVPRSIENPGATHETNATGFLNMLQAAKEIGVSRFVYASSSSVYGDAIESPKYEDKLGKPLSPYAVSKLTNEQYGKVFHDLFGMQTIGLRYFNVFGKNQDPNGAYAAAIPKFIKLFVEGDQPMVYGDGEQTRDFTHISNVIHANELALFGTNSASFGQTFNVACGDSCSLNHVIQTIHKTLLNLGVIKQPLNINYVDDRPGDIRDSLADISKISSLLGYEVQNNFESGMQLYLDQIVNHKR